MDVKNLTLGEAIRIQRCRYALSQEKLGYIAGVHLSTISRWERGDCTDEMLIRHYLRIANALELPIPKIFIANGENLKKLRAKSGLTIENLAHKAGVHVSTVFRWERSSSLEKVSLKYIKKIAKALSAELPDYFWNKANEVHNAA